MLEIRTRNNLKRVPHLKKINKGILAVSPPLVCPAKLFGQVLFDKMKFSGASTGISRCHKRSCDTQAILSQLYGMF